MLVTVVVPIGIVLVVSLARRSAYGGFDWALTPEAYVRILFEADWDGNLVFNPQYLQVIARTAGLAALTTVICGLIALPVAYAISLARGRARVALVFLVTLPFWVSMIVRVYA